MSRFIAIFPLGMALFFGAAAVDCWMTVWREKFGDMWVMGFGVGMLSSAACVALIGLTVFILWGGLERARRGEAKGGV